MFNPSRRLVIHEKRKKKKENEKEKETSSLDGYSKINASGLQVHVGYKN